MKLSMPPHNLDPNPILEMARELCQPQDYPGGIGLYVYRYLRKVKRHRPYLFSFDLHTSGPEGAAYATFEHLELHTPERPKRTLIIVATAHSFCASDAGSNKVRVMPRPAFVTHTFHGMMQRILLASWWPQYVEPRPYAETAVLLKALR